MTNIILSMPNNSIMQRSQCPTSSLLLQLIALSNLVIFSAALRTAVPLSTPIRCSSRDAAELIQNRTANDNDGGLLVITCDASGRGGGSKHDGVASVLRIRHGVALLHRQQLTSITDGSSSSLVPTTTTAAASVDNTSSHQSPTSSGSNDEKTDLIQTISRRTIPSRTSSEVAAIAFGIKHAIKTVPLSLRNKVLILSDSEFALDFYCGEKSYGNRQQQPNTTVRRRTSSISNKRRGKRQPATRSIEIREESYWRLFATLLKETTPGGVILSKIKSSSRSVGLNTSRTSSVNNGDDTTSSIEGDDSTSSWDGKGFLDHDASDYLSSNARYISNNSDNEDDNNSPFRAVSRLTPDDLNWLAHSENDTVGVNGGKLLNDDIWNEVIVKGSDAREDRRRRKERRIDSIQGLLN
mmetsp:Transcript_16238/g.32691  ORF Transcript_16238/g.32691 Transcript_16238/m.32691 type:complete len:410 (-) Transcript_16238:3148-4377(-)